MNRLTRAHALAFMILCLLVAAALRLPGLLTLPPGVHFDEAAYGVNAIDIAFRGARPIFVPDYTGREVLFLYLVAGMMRLFGPTLFALRLTAAFLGLLTVAATYWLGREMLADRRIALLAAALLAVSFWHVLFSHLGFRVISQPLLQALALAALFRALRTHRWPWFAVAGALIGLTAYTYLAARLFPIVLLIGLLPLLLDHPGAGRRRQQLLFTALVAFLVALPLLAYFYNHPDAFWTRITQVAPGQSELTLGRSFLRSLGMFFLSGDPYLRFNIPERPLFDFIWGGLLVVGWVFIVLRQRRQPYDWQRAALLLLVAAPLIMVLPTALAVNEIVPSNLRALGLIPFIFYLPAIGLITLLRDVERRFQRPSLTQAVNVVVLLVLVSGIATYDLFYNRWGREPELVAITDGDLTAAAPYLDAALGETNPPPTAYVASPHYRHPTVAFLSERYDELKWLPGSRAVVFPAGGPALYLYPLNSPAPDWVLPWLERGGEPEIMEGASGDELFRVYRLDEPPLVEPAADPASGLPLQLAGAVTLLAAEAEPAAAGNTLPITLVWRVSETLPPGGAPRAVPFVHLEDEAGHRWSQVESDAYPAEQWAPGETIIQRVELPLPAGMPPGETYRARIGLFDPGSGRPLGTADEGGRYAGDAVTLEGITVEAGEVPDPLPQPPQPHEQPMAGGLTLLGYERGGSRVETGETVGFGLWWAADRALAALGRRLSLVNESGQETVLVDGQPAYGRYPFAEWPAPAFVIDRQTAVIPDDLPAGTYRYLARVIDENGVPGAAADLGQVDVVKTDRVYAVPTVGTAVDALFGDEVRLLGYERLPDAGGAQLTLYWQAEAQPRQDYTVFVHALNADGTCCAWQADALPRGGAYPTTRWRPGEVVADSYTISVPPGEYEMEIGLYMAATGQRLPVTPGEPGQDALRLETLVVEE